MRSDKHKELSFYRLPSKNSKIYNEWVIKGSLNNPSKKSRMCSTHFINGKHDCPDTVPTIFPWSKLWKTPAERPFVLAVRELARGMTVKDIRLAIEHHHNYCSPPYTSTKVTTITESETIRLPPVSDYLTSPPSKLTVVHVPFRLELVQHSDQLVHFYTAFSNFESLQICFRFLGDPYTNYIIGTRERVLCQLRKWRQKV